jgi:hypothetical protein
MLCVWLQVKNQGHRLCLPLLLVVVVVLLLLLPLLPLLALLLPKPSSCAAACANDICCLPLSYAAALRHLPLLKGEI